MRVKATRREIRRVRYARKVQVTLAARLGAFVAINCASSWSVADSFVLIALKKQRLTGYQIGEQVTKEKRCARCIRASFCESGVQSGRDFNVNVNIARRGGI